jgi:hypothetical protein
MSQYPEHSYIKTETHHKGKLVTKEFFDSNPEVFSNYPTTEQILNVKNQIGLKKEPEVFYTIIISEFGISINDSKEASR